MKVSVNRKVINKSTDWTTLTECFENEDLTLEELAKEVDAGHAFSTQHDGIRETANFKTAGYIGLDFDRADQDDVKTILNTALVSNYFGLFYYTPSSTPIAPRFRLVFELDQPIYDAIYYKQVVSAFIWKFAANGKGVDKNCSDPCRLFYGHKNSKPIHTKNILPMAVVVSVLNEYRVYLEQERKIKETAEAERRKLTSPTGPGGNSLKGKKAYFEKLLNTHCEKIRQAPKGSRHPTLRNSAMVMGGYLAGEPTVADEYEIRRRLEEAYSVHENLDRREMGKAIDWGFDHGRTEPLYIAPLPEYKNIIDFIGWTGQGQKQDQGSNVDPETGEVIEDEEVAQPETSIPKHRYHAYELDQLPPVRWILPGFLQDNALNLLSGDGGIGKTYIALNWAMEVAREYNVLYVAAEDPSQFPERVKSWLTYHQPEECGFYLETLNIHLADQDRVIEIIKANNDIKPKLVVIDTYAAATEGNNENDNGAIEHILANTRLFLQVWECAVLLVHHFNKGGTAERGGSGLRNGILVAMKLMPEGDGVKVEFDKIRNGPAQADVNYRWQEVEIKMFIDGKPESRSNRVPIQTDTTFVDMTRLTSGQETILRWMGSDLRRKEWHTIKDIIDNTNAKERTLMMHIAKLKALDFIFQPKAKGPYQITAKGIDAVGLGTIFEGFK